MRVRCNTDNKWAVHHAWGPEFAIEKGMELTTDKCPANTNLKDWGEFIHKLLEAGHAEMIPDEKAEVETAPEAKSEDNQAEVDSNEAEEKTAEPTHETLKAELEGIALKEMDGPMGSEQKAKAALEVIGKERYGFDVDKRKNVDNIIEAIVEAASKVE